MLAFRRCCSAAVWNCITSVAARMCHSRLGGRACLRRYTFLGICWAHQVAPVHPTETQAIPATPFCHRTQVRTKEQKETWFWHNSYCFIFPARLVPATTFGPIVSSVGITRSGITQRLWSRHATTLVTPLLLSLNLFPLVFDPYCTSLTNWNKRLSRVPLLARILIGYDRR